MRRRDFLISGGGAAAFGLGSRNAPRSATPEETAAAPSRPAVFVPGYERARAWAQGMNVRDHPWYGRNIPPGYDGNATLLTRIGAEGEVTRAVFPVRGHGVAVHAGRRIGVFASMSGRQMVSFDAETLDLLGWSDPFAEGFVGGGHAAFTPAGDVVVATERFPYLPYRGDPRAHYGRLVLRDPVDLRPLEAYDCHGVAPHEVRLLEGGTLTAIANYGSTPPPAGTPPSPRRHVVEPSITVLELASGRLVEKIPGPDLALEIRHLVAPDRRRLFAVQVLLDSEERGRRRMREAARAAVYELDRLADPGEAYLPAPLLAVRRGEGKATRRTTLSTEDPLAMRHGLSIVHDPVHEEVIATFPSSHAVVVVDARRAEIRRVIPSRAFGISWPCGIALHPDGERYLLAGSFENLVAVRRGSHELDPRGRHYLPLFRHSHIAVA